MELSRKGCSVTFDSGGETFKPAGKALPWKADTEALGDEAPVERVWRAGSRAARGPHLLSFNFGALPGTLGTVHVS